MTPPAERPAGGAPYPYPPPGPLAALLGIEPESILEGRSRFGLVLRTEHLNPYGIVHGGVVYSLVDTAMGAALVSRLEPGERCTTVEIKINYLTPASEGRLDAEAVVVERTRRLGVLEGRVTNGAGRLVALATGTFYIIQGGS